MGTQKRTEESPPSASDCPISSEAKPTAPRLAMVMTPAAVLNEWRMNSLLSINFGDSEAASALPGTGLSLNLLAILTPRTVSIPRGRSK